MATQNTAPTFSTGDGKVISPVGFFSAVDSRIQGDGKILVLGTYKYEAAVTAGSNFALARYSSNGFLDTSFGNDGIVSTNLGGLYGGAECIVLQKDGKMLVAGLTDSTVSDTNPDLVLVRYNSDGTLDTTFGSNGKVVGDFSQYDRFNSIALQADGKILLAGTIGSNLALLRYDITGDLDSSFGIGGKAVLNSRSGSQSLAVQTDGKILVAGANDTGALLIRYNIDGSFDTSFGHNGVVTSKVCNSNERVIIQEDGKIIVSGQSSLNDFSLLRYNQDGSLDKGFGSEGVVGTSSLGGYFIQINSITAQPDGKILVAGGVLMNPPYNYDFVVLRYNINGSLDTSFGTNGRVTTDFQTNSSQTSSDIGGSLSLITNGGILLVGTATVNNNTDVTMARYNRDGSLDITFNPINTLHDIVVSAEVNKTVVIGSTVNVTDSELYVLGNYDQARLTIQRHGGADTNDLFGFVSPITISNGVLNYSGTSIGVLTQNHGTLDLTFNSNATQSVVTTVLRSVTYTNIENVSATGITLDWIFNDGNTGLQGGGGNAIANGSSVVNITDLTPPTIINFSPASYATNVAVNSNILLTFSEGIQRGLSNIILKNSIGTIIATYNAESGSNINITGNTLTINPSSDLAFSTRYIVEITTGSVKDLSGNSYLGTSAYEFTTTAPNNPPTGSITITGNPIQGKVLTTSGSINDIDGMGTLTGQWFRDGFAVTGATDVSYTLTQADVGKSISATAYYTDGLGKLESINSNEVKIANINDAPIGNVTITGTATQNQILTAKNTLTDVDGLGAISYQWLSNNKEISNASQSTYKLAQSDVGNVISVKASYTDGFGSKETVTSAATVKIEDVNDAPTGNVSISGLAAQGQTLTIVNTLADLDGLGTIKYQWLSNAAVISGGTKTSYVLGSSDIGKTISVKASYTDLLGTSESVTSQPTDAVISTKPSKGNDVLTGTAKNDTLSALAGNDILAGGLGADKLTGGLGADIFKYTSIDDSGVAVKTRDTITDFKHSESDKIDLSAIDANSSLPNDQSFTYIGTKIFSKDATAQLRLDPKTGILYGSTNADNTPEFSILLSGVKSLVPEGFVL